MAFWQTSQSKRLITQPQPYNADTVCRADFKFTFSSTFTAASDVLELGLLPAFCEIVDYMVIPENMNGNATIGFMSGEFGNKDDTRTVGAELFSATTLASTMIRATISTGLLTAASETTHRAIGFKNSADITGAANKKITLRVFYAPAAI